jgi:hypothetical protein
MKKDIIRARDRVVVINPLNVVRVGYPKELKDYLPEVVEKYRPQLLDMMKACGDFGSTEKMEHELAYSLAKKDGFGGVERTLHVELREDLRGREFFVQEVKTRYAGNYCHGVNVYSHWDGEVDYEPACLSDSKAHRICELGFFFGKDGAYNVRIEAINLEKVK